VYLLSVGAHGIQHQGLSRARSEEKSLLGKEPAS
jgi:hypothetical protein